MTLRDWLPPAAVEVARSALRRPGTREQRELQRLFDLPFGAATDTDLAGPRLHAVHAQSFAWQFKMIYQDGQYDFGADTGQPTIIDGGANIGLASVFWKQRYPGARIVAFEADPFIAGVMQRNLAAADATDVEVVVAALAAEPGTLRFRHDKGDAGRVTDDGDIEVPAVPLAPYLAEHVDLLKLDIEGAETDVLRACQADLCNVDRVFVEYHSIVGRPQQLGELHDLLATAGFRVHIRSEYCSPRPFRRVEPMDGMDVRLNLWAVRP